mmetsp:Transcript_109505/g.193550  ORF Transcript_109505/g.193550 Transcript_109505/m.193550 type:complete len:109 (-) Transcript_109505:71-397(-)
MMVLPPEVKRQMCGFAASSFKEGFKRLQAHGQYDEELSVLNFRELPKEHKFSNQQLAMCEHIEKFFKDTRVTEKDQGFLERIGKGARSACMKHPVLVVGAWRQGKSTL